jgi:hypothetical protein
MLGIPRVERDVAILTLDIKGVRAGELDDLVGAFPRRFKSRRRRDDLLHNPVPKC